jgi:hypothetical protein
MIDKISAGFMHVFVNIANNYKSGVSDFFEMGAYVIRV